MPFKLEALFRAHKRPRLHLPNPFHGVGDTALNRKLGNWSDQQSHIPGFCENGGLLYWYSLGIKKGQMIWFCHICVTDQDWVWGIKLVVKRIYDYVSFIFRMKQRNPGKSLILLNMHIYPPYEEINTPLWLFTFVVTAHIKLSLAIKSKKMRTKSTRTLQILASVGAALYLLIIAMMVFHDSYPIFKPFDLEEVLLLVFISGFALSWTNKRIAAGIHFFLFL